MVDRDRVIPPTGDIIVARDDRLALGGRRSPGALVLTDILEGDAGRCEFPINPPEITVRKGRQTTTVPIINLGEVLLPGSLMLAEISFEAILPRYYDSTLCNFSDGIDDTFPETAVSRIAYWMGEREGAPQENPTVLRVTIADGGFSRNMVVTQLDHTDKGGEPDALYVSITLKEWREQTIEVTRGEPRARVEPTQVAVARGDGYPPVESISAANLAVGYLAAFGPEVTAQLQEVIAAEDRAERLRTQADANPTDLALNLAAVQAERTARIMRAEFERTIEDLTGEQQTFGDAVRDFYADNQGGGYIPLAPIPTEVRGLFPGSGGTAEVAPATPARENRRPIPSTYRTNGNESLYQIAIKVYGDGEGDRWRILLAHNRTAIRGTQLRGAVPRPDPSRYTPIRAGVNLSIPSPVLAG